MAKGKLLAIAFALVSLAYPLLVYFGLQHFEPRWVAAFLVMMVLARLLSNRTLFSYGIAAAAIALGLLAWVGNAWLPLKLYPVGVNAFFLITFGLSLVYPPSAVERLARIKEPSLSVEGVRYTRRVTQVWVCFFVINGSIALGTSLWASDAVWTVYNGLIAYCLMGALAAIELLIRRRLKKQAR
jgi:uncharacterized membrane protein